MGMHASTATPRNRHVARAVAHAFDHMSTTSLLAWRSTSRDNFAQVNVELRSSLIVLISRFFSNPLAFLDTLTPWGALIVGEAALSHILHDPSICTTTFELAVGNINYHPFLDNIAQLFPAESTLISRLDMPSPNGFEFYRHITHVTEFRLESGLTVVVYESSTPSACDVVAGHWTTALMNFVTEYSVGCAYPRLTLNNRALACDIRASSMTWSDRIFAIRLQDHGFEFRGYPHGWSMYARGPSSSSSPTVEGCGRSLYICPLQGRYFGDSGSLVLFLAGLSVDLEEMRDLLVAPYGTMVTWRIPSSGLCASNCLEKDTAIPPFSVSVLTQFMEDNPAASRSSNLDPATMVIDRENPPSRVQTSCSFTEVRRHSL